MKLLFVGTDRERGGGAAHFIALAQAMANAGNDVDALVDPRSAIGEGLAGSEVSVHHARFRNALDPGAHSALLRTIRKARPDWLVGNFGKEYWPLIVQGHLLGTPVALFRHRAPPLKRISAYLLPRLAQRFIAVSQHSRDLFIERGMPADRVQMLYNPVDTDHYRPDRERGMRLRRSLGIPDTAVVVGFVGRMYEGKGIFCLLEAMTTVMHEQQNVHCLWVGEGPDLTRLASAIRSTGQGARHHLCGWQTDLRDHYAAMSMLAFPTLATETFGRTSVEAQASGVPVLGSRIGGIPETMVEGQTGCLLEPGNASIWHDAILALCAPPLAARMGAAARESAVQRFSYPVIAQGFADMLQPGG